MNNQFFQQAEQLFRPISEMMALNARTLEALTEKQTSFMTDIWNDGLNCARDLSGKRDMSSFYASQQNFWEGFNQKFSSTARDSYNLLTEAQEEMGKLMQDSISAVDIQSAAEPFMRTASQAQSAAQETASRTQQAAQSAAQDTASRAQQTAQNAARSTAKTAQKTQSQTGKNNR